MAQGARGHPCPAAASALTGPCKQPYQSVVPQGLASPPTTTANKEHQRRLGLARSLGQHVGAKSSQRLGLEQVHDALETGLRAYALRMVSPMPHDDSTTSISDILQVEAKRFTGSETTLQHQQYQRPIAQAAQLLEQRLHLNIIQRSRHALDGLDVHAAPHRLLATSRPHERPMPLGDASQGGI